MIDLDSDQLSEVKSILKAHVPSCEVRVFGSRVSGGAQKYSDLDLALVSTEPLTLRQLEQLKEAFEASNLSIRVDVLDWQRLSPEFQKQILLAYQVLDF